MSRAGRERESMKRLTVWVLCVAMVLGVWPPGVVLSWAEEEDLTCRMHSNNPYDSRYAAYQDTITLEGTAGPGVEITAVTLGGLTATFVQSEGIWSASVRGDGRIPQGTVAFSVAYEKNGQASVCETLTTGPAVILDMIAPQDAEPFAESPSPTAILVTANILGLEGDVAPIHPVGYKYDIKDSRHETFWVSSDTYLFIGLEPNTSYYVKNRARDAAGNENKDYHCVNSLCTRAADPESIRMTDRTDASLAWELTNSEQNTPPENRLILKDSEGNLVSETGFSTDLSGAFSDLTPGTNYELWSVTRNQEGVENAPRLYWSGATRQPPTGAVTAPLEDVWLRPGEGLDISGTWTDADGDAPFLQAFLGDLPGETELGETTWSAFWPGESLPEGLQGEILVKLSDDGGGTPSSLPWPYAVTVDGSAPTLSAWTISTTHADPDWVVPGDVLHLSFETDEPVVTPEAFLDGVAGQVSGGPVTWEARWEMEAGRFEEGPLACSLCLTDRAGNGSTADLPCPATFDSLSPPPPVIQASPESGTSRSRVVLSAAAGDAAETVTLEYRLKASEDGWTLYEAPVEVTEKGTWTFEARAVDPAGNVSAPASLEIRLLEARKRRSEPEPEPEPPEVDRWEVRLPHVVPTGIRLRTEDVLTALDAEGGVLPPGALSLESSDPSILKVLEDGSLAALAPGQAVLRIESLEAGRVWAMSLLVEKAPGPELPPFPDANGHWAEAALLRARAGGILPGYPNVRLRPDATVTLAEALAMVEREHLSARVPEGCSRNDAFADCPGADWALPYARAVFGRMEEKALDYFGERPDLAGPLSRGLAAALITGSEQWTEEAGPESRFVDAAGHPCAGAIGRVCARGLLEGYPDGSFKPDGTITRAEMALILDRLATLREKQENLR